MLVSPPAEKWNQNLQARILPQQSPGRQHRSHEISEPERSLLQRKKHCLQPHQVAIILPLHQSMEAGNTQRFCHGEGHLDWLFGSYRFGDTRCLQADLFGFERNAIIQYPLQYSRTSTSSWCLISCKSMMCIFSSWQWSRKSVWTNNVTPSRSTSTVGPQCWLVRGCAEHSAIQQCRASCWL